MKKRIVSILLLLAFCLSLYACGTSERNKDDDNIEAKFPQLGTESTEYSGLNTDPTEHLEKNTKPTTQNKTDGVFINEDIKYLEEELADILTEYLYGNEHKFESDAIYSILELFYTVNIEDYKSDEAVQWFINTVVNHYLNALYDCAAYDSYRRGSNGDKIQESAEDFIERELEGLLAGYYSSNGILSVGKFYSKGDYNCNDFGFGSEECEYCSGRTDYYSTYDVIN